MENKHPSVNYLFFGSILAVLLLISASAVFIKDSLNESKIFFFLYGAGQAFLEIVLLIFCTSLIERASSKRVFHFFIGAVFIFFILHLLDFIVERILDLSIWETIGFVLDEDLTNFIYLLDASGISLWLWGVMCLVVLSLPFLGILLYRCSSKIVKNKPLFLRREWFFQVFIALPIALVFWEYSASPVIDPNSYTSLIKSLPWKFTFLPPEKIYLPLSSPLKQPLEEKSMMAAIENYQGSLSSKPNIYLFVVESFREDFIKPEIAPHLTQFKNEAYHFDLALSNANGTHPSWFSIFHSQFPFCWNQLRQKKWSMGSPPIHLLKKLGYKVRVYSSAQLNYYGMEELLFGKNRQLIDSFQPYLHAASISAADSDAMAIHKLQEDLKDPSLQQEQLVIVFLDSTHFDYSWPKSSEPKFTPIAKDFAYFHFFYSKEDIEQIKNRYRNAIFHIDSLLGQFMKNIPHQEEAVLVIVGDHGEEFLEHGNLFHCSHLVHEQTNVPLYMKLGKNQRQPKTQLVSQMDIFPTIFHHLTGQEIDLFEGKSIFSSTPWPYVVMARFNASRTPYEFCIHNGKYKFIAQFTDKKNIFSSKQLKIKSLCNDKDVYFSQSQEKIYEWIETEFGKAFERLF